MVKFTYFVLFFTLMACGSEDSGSKAPEGSKFRACHDVEAPILREFSSISQVSIDETEQGKFVAESEDLWITLDNSERVSHVYLKNGEIDCADDLTGFYASAKVLAPVEFRLVFDGDLAIVFDAMMKMDALEFDSTTPITHRSRELQPSDISDLGFVENIQEFSAQQVGGLIEARSSLGESKWFKAPSGENQIPSRYVLLQKSESSGLALWKKTVYILEKDLDSGYPESISPALASPADPLPIQMPKDQNHVMSFTGCQANSQGDTLKALVEAAENELSQQVAGSPLDRRESGFYLYQSQQIFLRIEEGASVHHLSFEDGLSDCAELYGLEGLVFKEAIRAPHEFILAASDGRQPVVVAAGIREDIVTKHAGDNQVFVTPGYLEPKPHAESTVPNQSLLDREETLAFLNHAHPAYQVKWIRLSQKDDYGRSLFVLLQKTQSDQMEVWKRTIYAYVEDHSFEDLPPEKGMNESTNVFKNIFMFIIKGLGI